MKKTAFRLTTIVLAVILLISFAVIPAAAESDFYENTYNYYYYSCRSSCDIFLCTAHMYYANPAVSIKSKIIARVVNLDDWSLYIVTAPNIQYINCGIEIGIDPDEYNIYHDAFVDANYEYSVGTNIVYSTYCG